MALFVDLKQGDIIRIDGLATIEFMEKTGRKARLKIKADEAIQITVLSPKDDPTSAA